MTRGSLRLTFYGLWDSTDRPVPALIATVHAGTPIQVSSDIELVDLNYLFSRGSEDTLLVRVDGDSMCDEIASGDYVIVTKSRPPVDGNIVIAELDGEFTLKRFRLKDHPQQRLYLVPANSNYKPREVLPADNIRIVGVVTTIIHSL